MTEAWIVPWSVAFAMIKLLPKRSVKELCSEVTTDRNKMQVSSDMQTKLELLILNSDSKLLLHIRTYEIFELLMDRYLYQSKYIMTRIFKIP